VEFLPHDAAHDDKTCAGLCQWALALLRRRFLSCSRRLATSSGTLYAPRTRPAFPFTVLGRLVGLSRQRAARIVGDG
jgi:hypothetical protein